MCEGTASVLTRRQVGLRRPAERLSPCAFLVKFSIGDRHRTSMAIQVLALFRTGWTT
mgnify:CR=1 FL=1